MSGRVRVELPDGRTVTGYRKTLRQNPRRDPGTAPELRLAFILPALLAFSTARGPYNSVIEVGPLGNVAVTLATFNRDRVFAAAAEFLREITPRGCHHYQLAAELTASHEPNWRARWRLTFIDGHVMAALTPIDLLVFAEPA